MTVSVLRIVSSPQGGARDKLSLPLPQGLRNPLGRESRVFFDVFWLVWDRVFPLARGLFVPSGGLLDRSNSGTGRAASRRAASNTPPTPSPRHTTAPVTTPGHRYEHSGRSS